MFIPSGVKQQASIYVPGVLPDLPAGPVMHYDVSDISTLWQNSGRTTPVTANGDTVAAWDPVEINGGSGNYVIGSGTYVDGQLGFGPGMKLLSGSFTEQVPGTSGGAVPPGGANPRFIFAVVSSAGANPNSGQQPAIVHWGGQTAGTDRNWTVGRNGSTGSYNISPQYVATGDTISSNSQASVSAYPCSNAIVMAWYDGSNIVVSQDGVESTPHPIVLDTVTSTTLASQGLRMGSFVGENWSNQIIYHELAVYDFVPSPAERTLILNYAKNKWPRMGEQYSMIIDVSDPETSRDGSNIPLVGYGGTVSNLRTSSYIDISGTGTKESTAYGDAVRITSTFGTSNISGRAHECSTNTNGGKTFALVVSNIGAGSGTHHPVFGHSIQVNQFSPSSSYILNRRLNSTDFWSTSFHSSYGSVGWVTPEVPSSGLNIVFGWNDGADNTYMQVNGGTIHTDNRTALDGGAFQNWIIGAGVDLHEVRSWSRMLPDAERNALYSELTAKWGTP